MICFCLFVLSSTHRFDATYKVRLTIQLKESLPGRKIYQEQITYLMGMWELSFLFLFVRDTSSLLASHLRSLMIQTYEVDGKSYSLDMQGTDKSWKRPRELPFFFTMYCLDGLHPSLKFQDSLVWTVTFCLKRNEKKEKQRQHKKGEKR